MLITNNKDKINCVTCNKKDIIYKMYIFNNRLHCFKCSIEKLKGVYKNEYIKR